MARIRNISRDLQGPVPQDIMDNGAWFLYLSNQIEMDLIKSETNRRALAGGSNGSKYKVKR